MEPTIPPKQPVSAETSISRETLPPAYKGGPNRLVFITLGIITLLAITAFGIDRFTRKTSPVILAPTPQPGITSTERTSLGDTAATGPTLLQVTQVIADQGNFSTISAKSLQVTADTNIGGNLSVNGNGNFGGTLSAANFTGSGAGLTGTNAAFLSGHTGSFYLDATNLQGKIGDNKLSANIALRNSPNTFSSSNTFDAGLSASGVTTGSITVTGPASLSGTTTISSLILSSQLAVSSGGTGLTTIPVNGVVFGQGASSVGVAVPASAGQCLLSTSTSVQFGSCSGSAGSGVNSFDALSGDLVLNNSSAIGSNVTLDNASTFAKGIAEFNATNFTVISGVVNTAQNLAVVSSPTFAGLNLTTPLSVSSGGTGTSSLATGGIVIGQGTGAATTVAAGSAGQCLLSTNGNPAFAACPSTAAVTTLNGLNGALSVANATTSGSTITVNDSASATKGIASFNAANFTVTAGAVNTIQNIAVGSTPTFAGLNLSTALGVNNGGTGSNTVTGARTVLGAAGSGVNTDITSLTGLTTAVSTAQGGTGIITTPTNGQILIGTGAGYSLNTLTAGSGINISNASGSITIAATGGGICASCATSSLSNLAAVAINTSLLPATAGAADLGSSIVPFGQLSLAGSSSSPSVNNFLITGASTSGTRTITLPDSSGTVAVSATGPLSIDALGNVSCSTCLTSGGAGGVSSLNSATGALTLQGVSAGSISVAGSTITVADATAAVKGLASFNGSNFSVSSGAVNTVQNISSSASPSFAGLSLGTALSVANGGTGVTTGTAARIAFGAAASGNNSDITSLTGLTTALTVGQGGIGTNTLTANGVVLGNGASALSAVTGTNGQCLVVVGTAPTFTTCTGAGGVSSVNSQSGAITIANASANSGTVTLNDASTLTKGIVSFNGTNFNITGGVANTVQDISTTASPTFGQLALSSAGSLTLGASGATAGSTKFFDGTTTFGNILNTSSLTSARTISLPDESGVLCLRNSSNCGFLTGSAADASYIQLQSNTPGTPQTGNMNITGSGIFGTAVSTINVTASGQTILGGASNNTQLVLKSGPTQKDNTGTENIPYINFLDASSVVALSISSDNASNAYFGAGAGISNNYTGSNGNQNTFIGNNSGGLNTSGSQNTYVGGDSGLGNVIGRQNTALGGGALQSNTSNGSTAVGAGALYGATTGSYNTALGNSTGTAISTGSNNTFVGNLAGSTDINNYFSTGATLQNATAVGAYAQVQANNSIVLGSVDTTTNVGIGITVPINTLSVSPLDVQNGKVTRTNASKVIVGTATTWVSSMVGDIIVFVDGTTSTITGYTDATHVTMSSAYAGTTDAAPIYYRFHKVGLQVATSGNVGIGMNPTANALSVQGTVAASVFQQNGNTVCDSSSNCTNYLSSANGVALQVSTPGVAQTGNINITGSVVAGTAVTSPIVKTSAVDTDSTGALSIGGTNATGINLGNGSAGINLMNNGSNSTWITNTNPEPAAEFSTGTATYNGFVYKVGVGGSSKSTLYARQNADGSLGTWTTSGNLLPAAIGSSGAAVAASNGYLYAIRGNHVATIYYTKLATDGTIGAWTTSANPLPSGRYQSATATANGYIYVVGGIDSGEMPRAEVFIAKTNSDGSTSSWSTSTMSQTDPYPAVTIANGFIYVVSGDGLNSHTFNTIEWTKLNSDGTAGTWNVSNFINAPPNGPYQYSAVSSAGGYLYIAGGLQSSTPATSAAVYYAKLNNDGTWGSWTTSANSMPAPRYSSGYATLNGYFYVLGGYNAGTQSTVFYTSLQHNSIQGSTVFDGTVSGADAQNTNEFATLGQVSALLNGNATANVSLQAASPGTAQSGNLNLSGIGLFSTAVATASIRPIADSTSALTFTNAAGTTTIATFDSVNSQLIIGTGANTLTFSPTTGIVASGTARHTKSISLNAQYPSSVLDATNDPACSSANNGTMTNGYYNSGTNNINYYQWTTAQATAQCYDVVAQITIPADFSAWASATPLAIQSNTTSTSLGTVKATVIDTSGTTETGYSYASVTPATPSTWTTVTGASSLSGSYTPGSTMTVRLRITATSAAVVELGSLNLNYLSKF